MATRAKYTRAKGNNENNEQKLDTDILMRFSPTYGKIFIDLGRYVARALTLFFGESKNFVTIKAAEKLMDKALWVAEVVRRKVEGLHMIVNVAERIIVDIWEPKEEGLVTVR